MGILARSLMVAEPWGLMLSGLSVATKLIHSVIWLRSLGSVAISVGMRLRFRLIAWSLVFLISILSVVARTVFG